MGMQQEVLWRSVEADAPSPGCFVELSRDEDAKAGEGVSIKLTGSRIDGVMRACSGVRSRLR